jgi:hypothetical protein
MIISISPAVLLAIVAVLASRLIGQADLPAEALLTQYEGMLQALGAPACATQLHSNCFIEQGNLAAIMTVTGSMSVTATVPADRIPPGVVAMISHRTTQGVESFACPPALAGQVTVCQGQLQGSILHGTTMRVQANGRLVGLGIVRGVEGEQRLRALLAAPGAQQLSPPVCSSSRPHPRSSCRRRPRPSSCLWSAPAPCQAICRVVACREGVGPPVSQG